MQIKKSWCFWIMGFLLPLLSHGQDYTFARLSITDGLASNFVYSVWQDPKGFLWLGTDNGLQRYDGRKIVSFYDHGVSNFLPSLPVQQILDDENGRMWVRMGRRVGVFNPSSMDFREAAITGIDEAANNADFHLWKDYYGRIYLLIVRYGVLVYNASANRFEKGKLPFSMPDNWKPVQLFQDKQTSDTWIATDSGLVVYNVKEGSWFTHSKPSPQYPVLTKLSQLRNVNSVHIDSKRRCWVGWWDYTSTSGGQRLLCYDGTSNQVTRDSTGFYFSSRYYKEILHMQELRNGALWVHGLNLLVKYDSVQQRLMNFEYPPEADHGIRFNYVYQILEDNENMLWFATDNGLYSTSQDESCSMRLMLSKQKSPANITSLQEMSDKDIWIGTWGRGVISMTDTNLTKPFYRNMPAGPEYRLVWDLLYQEDHNRLWAGCQSGRVMLFDTKKKQSLFLKPDACNGRTIRDMALDRNGNVWLGTQGGQLVRWKAGSTLENSSFEKVADLGTVIFRLYTDSGGRLWVGTHGKGLYVFDVKSSKQVGHYNVPENGVTDIVQLNDSIMALGGGQLNLLNFVTGKVSTLTIRDGLPGNNITSLQTDMFGQLWISTKNGLCKYNPRLKIFTRYDQRDGLITTTSHETLLGTNIRKKNGELVFAGNQHAVFFNPACFISKSAPQDVRITDFKLFNQFLPPDSILRLDKIRLRAEENSITFAFASLSFRQRDKLIYYYMLEGADKTWQRADWRLIAIYNLLPPGNYTFKVRCENEEGISSPNITTLELFIKPPFWRTWWFMTLAVIALGVIAYFIHRLRVNRLMAVERVRRRVARDLHDDMGSTLSTINILSEMAKMKITSDTNSTREYIEKISDNSTRMMEAMDDIVWSINPMNDNMQKITARMREFAASVLEPKGIEYTFRIGDHVKDLVLDMEARRDFFLIFKEAVNNLAKYSQANNAVIELYAANGKLNMHIQDNGIGFESETADNGNGLTNMKKRSEMMKGDLSITSGRNAGTLIRLEVPLT
jgi:signal transduction histidine kinase/ligand-binding sensor domain-containing protein